MFFIVGYLGALNLFYLDINIILRYTFCGIIFDFARWPRPPTERLPRRRHRRRGRLIQRGDWRLPPRLLGRLCEPKLSVFDLCGQLYLLRARLLRMRRGLAWYSDEPPAGSRTRRGGGHPRLHVERNLHRDQQRPV